MYHKNSTGQDFLSPNYDVVSADYDVRPSFGTSHIRCASDVFRTHSSFVT